MCVGARSIGHGLGCAVYGLGLRVYVLGLIRV